MKAITTKFTGPSSRRGSRITARDSDGNKVVFDHSYANSHDEAHANAARALCKKMGWQGVLIQGSLGPGQEVFVWLGGELDTLKLIQVLEGIPGVMMV